MLGVETSYWDVAGHHHEASTEALRARRRGGRGRPPAGRPTHAEPVVVGRPTASPPAAAAMPSSCSPTAPASTSPSTATSRSAGRSRSAATVWRVGAAEESTVVVPPTTMPQSARSPPAPGCSCRCTRCGSDDGRFPSFAHLADVLHPGRPARRRRFVATLPLYAGVPRRSLRPEPVLADQPAALERGLPRRPVAARPRRSRRRATSSTGRSSPVAAAASCSRRPPTSIRTCRPASTRCVTARPDVARYARFRAGRPTPADAGTRPSPSSAATSSPSSSPRPARRHRDRRAAPRARPARSAAIPPGTRRGPTATSARRA